MASNSPDTRSKKPRKIGRAAIGFNVLVQILVIIFIVICANYMAFKHFKRWDLSRSNKYALSDQTKRVLGNLPKPLKIYMFFSPDPRLPGGEVFPDLDALLKEYQYAAKGKVEVETVNIYKDLSRAKELMAQYKFGNENVVIVDYQGHSKLLNTTDMADYDPANEMTGEPAKLHAFKGEQALTSAILEVSEDKQNKIYFVGGKGGPQIDSNDLSALKTYLERQNLKLDTKVLMNIDKVPDDANALLLLGARYDLTDRELKLLRDYWDKQGRILIALDPSGTTPKLAAFLRDVGVSPQDDRVLKTVPMGPVTGVLRDVEVLFSDTSPVTKRLRGVDTTFLGQTQSLAMLQNGAVRMQQLVTATEGYWGETKYQNVEAGATVAYDPKEDISAPLNIAVSVEKGAPQDESVNMDTSRMIVIGNSTFLTNDALTEANVDFALSGLNWLLNRKDLIGIAPKNEEYFALNLTENQLERIELLVLAIIPAVVGMLGTAVWLKRRR